MKTIMLIITLLFATPVFAVPYAQAYENGDIQMYADSDLDVALRESYKQAQLDMARLMMDVSATFVTERIMLEERLQKDPNNKDLRAEYERAQGNERKSIEITKQFLRRLVLMYQ